MESTKPTSAKLIETMEITKNARYHAAERLNERATWKNGLLIIVSAYVLILSAFPSFAGGSSFTIFGLGLNFLTFSASLMLLILSGFAGLDDDRVRGQSLYDNAWRIGTILAELKRVSNSLTDNDVEDRYWSSYREAVEACKFRHDNVDYLPMKISRDKRAGRKVFAVRCYYLALYFFDVYAFPVLRVALPLAGVTILATGLRALK